MTPSQLEHLRRIDAHLERLLLTAEKRSIGAWGYYWGWDMVYSDSSGQRKMIADCVDRKDEQVRDDMAFIASCAGNAEAGWKATRAAIAEILAAHEARFESWCLVCQELNQDPGKLEDYPLPPWSEDILAAFPLELIQKP